MSPSNQKESAQSIFDAFSQDEHIDLLPEEIRPASIEEGYAAQDELMHLFADRLVGWKIAATNPAGQGHIGVDHPLAGRLIQGRVFSSGSSLSFGNNLMSVAEAEFAFTLGENLPPREKEYQIDEIRNAVTSLHPAIEFPDSRFSEFAEAGAPSLIADNACSRDFVLGEAFDDEWRGLDLAKQPVELLIDEVPVTIGQGADVLGGPFEALAWLVNQACIMGIGVKQGEIVTTGVCGKPSPIRAGNLVAAEFPGLGRVSAQLL